MIINNNNELGRHANKYLKHIKHIQHNKGINTKTDQANDVQ
jgi:hypothetical protein